MNWPSQMENGELLKAAEAANCDVLITSDQNIRHQQNLKGRKLALVVLGSNVWSIVGRHSAEITDRVNASRPGTISFIEMPVTARPDR